MVVYRPMTLVDLAGHLARVADGKMRWKLVWEFMEEYRRGPDDVQPALLQAEPPPTGDERGDTLLAALAEHLAAHTTSRQRSGPKRGSCGGRGSRRNWRSSVPTRRYGHQRPSASMASTCRPGTWRLRERC